MSSTQVDVYDDTINIKQKCAVAMYVWVALRINQNKWLMSTWAVHVFTYIIKALKKQVESDGGLCEFSHCVLSNHSNVLACRNGIRCSDDLFVNCIYGPKETSCGDALVWTTQHRYHMLLTG